mmetsp:Transcript_19941/g.60258  ORF Transcript_19941/g.60258 Transcript_19941/m.60258 type:complete len:961 (+) Transcript_19941:333-3215(+)
MRALTALRQHPMRYGFCIGRPAGARVGGLGPRPLTQRALPSTQLQARGRTTSGRAPVPEFSRRRAVAMATGPHAGPQRLPAQRGVIGSTSSKSLRNAVVVTSTAADASGPTDDASPSQADAAKAAAQAAKVQQVVTYFMGVMFIALATAVILRTGALQLFARALWQGISGAASGTAAAAAVLLTPGLHCRLKESLQQGGARSVVARASAVAEAGENEADDRAPAAEAGDASRSPRQSGVQSPASVWLPFRTSTEKQREKEERARQQREGSRFRQTLWRMSRLFRFTRRTPAWLISQLGFKIQQVALGGLLQKLVAVFIAGIPLVVVGGVAYAMVSGESVMEGFTAIYGCLYHIPGVVVLGEGTIARQIFTNFVWLVGTYLFAAILGVITGDIMERIQGLLSGNHPVVAVNHTVILNWNREMVPLLRQIAICQRERDSDVFSGDVVVMAEADKSKMDEEVRRALSSFSNIKWHTRTGAPHCVTDLESVAAGQAQTIILLHPEDPEGAARKQVAAVMGVQAARSSTTARPFMRLRPQNIAVQVPANPADAAVLETAGRVFEASNQRVSLTNMSGRRDMSLLLALSASQPGVASVYCAIVQQTSDGCEFYIKSFPGLEGCTYQEARRRLPDAILYGYISKKDKMLHANPPESDVLGEGDRVVALASTGFFKPYESAVAAGATYIDQKHNSPRPVPVKPDNDIHSMVPQNIVVVWHEGNIADLASSLQRFMPRGTTVTVVSKEEPEGFPAGAGGPILRCKIFWQEGDPLDERQLQRAGAAEADAVILGSADGQPPKQADALVLSTLVVLQGAVVKGDRDSDRPPLHVVGMVRRPETIGVANYLIGKLTKGAISAELLQPAELVSGAICQVAADPELAHLLANFLYSNEGQGISLQRPSAYGINGNMPVAFLDVQERARSRGETAIGYLEEAGPLHLAPHAMLRRAFNGGDRIIIVGQGATQLDH